MFYEVFIPAKEREEFDITVTVEADNWMVALKSGLERTGQLGDGIRNVMCDIKEDNSIHVTDGASQRVFVLKETANIDSSDSQSKTIQSKSAETKASVDIEDAGPTMQLKREHIKDAGPTTQLKTAHIKDAGPTTQLKTAHIKDAGPTTQLKTAHIKDAISSITIDPVLDEKPKPKPKPKVEVEVPEAASIPIIPLEGGGLEEKSYTSPDGRISIGSATYESLHRENSGAKIIREMRAPSGVRAAIKVEPKVQSSVFQNVLEDVFLEMQQIREREMGMEDVIEFVMNLVMDKIGAEAGSIMFADLSGTELYFAAARGPKANDVMDFRIPMGVGIVGFCVREGVSLSISDVEKDPRFHKEISDKLGYGTHNICCVPIQHEGRVYGAIELMNKSDVFAPQEVSALTYVGNQMAKYIFDLIMAQEQIS